MCIEVREQYFLKEDLTVWKACRPSAAGDWFLSFYPPDWRAPQIRGHHSIAAVFNELWKDVEHCDPGHTKTYRIGTTHRSKEPGMYCFPNESNARSFASRSYDPRVVLQCTIPAGTHVVVGHSDAGECMVVRALRVDSLYTQKSYGYGVMTKVA